MITRRTSWVLRRLTWSALAFGIGLAHVRPAAAEVRRVLLSVEGLNLRPMDSIRAFHIETWGVDFLAVCHVPPSWVLKLEKYEDSEGSFDGEADTGSERLRRLSDMYLVDVYEYQPLPKGDPKSDYHPASFAGWVVTGRVEAFDGGSHHKRKLTEANFHLRDADRCPVPPPAQP